MKTSGVFLALAASAASIVLPDPTVFEQLAIHGENKHQTDDSPKSLWDHVPSANDVLSSVEDFAGDMAGRVGHTLDSALDALAVASEDLGRGIEGLRNDLDGFTDDYFSDLENKNHDDDDDDDDNDNDGGRHGRRPHRPGHGHDGRRRGDKTKTIYELIKESNYTTKFSKLVDEYDDIASLLKDTKANHTLFVPTDKAFERLPGHGRHGGKDGDHDDLLGLFDDDDHEHKKPSREFILAVLQYHVVPGLYPAFRVLASHTLPTELKLHDLGDHPQRLRVSLGLGGVRVNLYARVVGVNFAAANGVIHAVDHVLVPPPRAGVLIKLLPSKFSTLTLALQNTGLDADLAELTRTSRGGTVFAPTNAAFARLGPRANAFLFSQRGRPFLRALLKYHVVANETLYSDAYYAGVDDGGSKAAFPGGPATRYHVDLPSLLYGKTISVDIRRWGGLIAIRVNGWVRVGIQDGIAEDGVIQVVDSVLIPPRRRGGREDDGKVTEEDLIERLGDYVEMDDNDGSQVVLGEL